MHPYTKKILQHLKAEIRSFAYIIRVAHLVNLLYFNTSTSLFFSHVSKTDKNFIKRTRKYDKNSNRLLFSWGEKFIVFHDVGVYLK